MKNFFYNHKEFIFGLALTSSLLWPLVAAPYFTHHDDVQIIRLYEINKCIIDHQIPCRWVPDLGGLYGYPIFNYYAPLPYYFGELIYLLTTNLIFSAKVMFAVSFLGAYIFMFLLASKLWGKLGGSLAGIFYSFMPYHAVDFYVRGAMGEMWALIFFPAIFWVLIRLEEKPSIQNLLILASCLFGLITAHNLSAMLFLPVSLIWVVLLFFKRRSKRFLWVFFGSLAIALLLSSFYLLPAIFEKQLVHLETTVSGYFSYTEHFKGLKKLFLERSWGWGSSIREVPGGEKDGLSFQIGWVHLLGWLLAIIAAKIIWRQNKWFGQVIIFSSLVTLFSIFMIHPRSDFIWRLVDSLKYLQFPWRFLILVTFFISLISGSLFSINFKKKNLIWFVLVGMVVVLNFSYFRPEKFIQTNDEDRLTGGNWDKQIKRSIFDYLPIYAKEPPAELAKERYQILTGESQIYDFNEGTNWLSFKTKTNTHTIVRLSQYYFPDWKIFVDGKEIMVEYKNNTLGLMTFILGKGEHEVWARLYDTPIRTLANLMSLAGTVLVTVLFLISFSKMRKWIAYYRKRMN